MDINFELILVLLTFLTGLIWLFDSVFLAPQRKKRILDKQISGKSLTKEDQDKLIKFPAIIEFGRSLFPIFLIVLLFRSFLFEPFRIPSGSLEPTLLIGDFILVNKFDYGIRLPVLHTKIIDLGEPKRGDIIVFRWPENTRIDYIKRVIGVPGDHISYINKELYINGKSAKQLFVNYAVDEGELTSSSPVILKTENLLGVNHEIYLRSDVPPDNFKSIIVPPGHYFVMGDNRDDSNDSRFWGFVPEENLIGKAVLIWMSWDSENNTVRFNRIGKLIH